MPRDLLPQTVYLTPAALAQAQRRASELQLPVSALLRLILLGHEAPLRSG
jgi:hypothetical protein